MRVRHGVPLRLVLVLPFLGLVLSTAMFIALMTQHQVHQAGRALGLAFATELGDRIEAQMKAQLAPVARVVEGNRDAFELGLLSLHAPLEAAPRLAAQMRLFPEFTFVTLALADGRYIAATRPPGSADPPLLAVNFLEGPLTLTSHVLASGDTPGPRVGGPLPYDPRERPFMRAVLDSDSPRWADTARYVGFDSLGLGLSAPLRDADGRLLAVTAVGISLEHVDRFFAGLALPEGGAVFLAESDGRLLSAGRLAEAVRSVDGELLRTRIDELPHAAMAELARRLPGFGGEAGDGVLEVRGRVYLHAVRPLRDVHGLDWVVGVVLPKDVFTAPITEGNRRNLMLIGGLLLLSALVGAWLAAAIARPIERVSGVAAAGDLAALSSAASATSGIREIDQLDRSLGAMAEQLTGLIGELEQRVEQRTADLQAVNAELQRINHLDALTGVANRRALDAALVVEWQRAQREQRPLALLLCDIDHFKSFNDHYGHPAGDEALREVASALAAVVRRPGDLVARYGGEEFAVLLPGTDEAGAVFVAQSLRAAMQALALRRDDIAGVDRVTLSIGVASLVPIEGLVPDRLLARADAQLYAAKAAGRDRVMPPSAAS